MVRDDGVAAEPQRIGARDGDWIRHPSFDDASAIAIKRLGIPERRLRTQRAETCIQVVESAVDQFQREHPAAKQPTERLVRRGIRAEPESEEQGLADE